MSLRSFLYYNCIRKTLWAIWYQATVTWFLGHEVHLPCYLFLSVHREVLMSPNLISVALFFPNPTFSEGPVPHTDIQEWKDKENYRLFKIQLSLNPQKIERHDAWRFSLHVYNMCCTPSDLQSPTLKSNTCSKVAIIQFFAYMHNHDFS